MNPWLIFILAVIGGSFLLNTTISLLNLKALSPDLPEEFADTYDQEKYRQSQDYTRVQTKFSLIENTIITVITIIFLLGGGFNLVDLFVRSFGLSSIPTGVVYAGSLALLSFILSLPFSIYSTFKIEAQFGFNRTTIQTFVTDIIKSILLTAALGAPLLAAVLWFFEHTGSYGWLLCWLGTVAFGFIVQFLAPVLIMPLFNRFTPLEEGPLKEKILAYARVQNFKLSGIFTMDGSKRSTKLNAFFTGFGKFRKIVFYDTLLEKIGDDELVSVLAHEMGHFKRHHIWKMMAISILQTGLVFYLLSLFINNPGLFEAFGMEYLSIYASLFFFAFIYSPFSTLLAILFNIMLRAHEFEADNYAARTTGAPDALVQALKKLSLANLSNLTPHPAMVFLSYSHPPVLERIRALRETKSLP
ncbi:MAG: M48 family metallopeptidase [Desulfofustis sp.]|nr:M48 family metallopeptidase [Desulfofustis sp.]MBT8346521.1 M48 family metallopeptidase [Desulfofustis sp.]NNK12924.1 M48 family metallopeptidase [Desulfofustis sp.]NNK56685.1 M48 family metallopeptidase [Desulfofustis sp.]